MQCRNEYAIYGMDAAPWWCYVVLCRRGRLVVMEGSLKFEFAGHSPRVVVSNRNRILVNILYSRSKLGEASAVGFIQIKLQHRGKHDRAVRTSLTSPRLRLDPRRYSLWQSTSTV